MGDIQFLAVAVAAITSFVLGGLWYSPALFGKAWCEEAGIDPKADTGHPARVFGTAFVFTFVAATGLAWLLGPAPGLGQAMKLSLLAGFVFVGTSFGVNYQFAGRSLKLLAIDAGYHTGQFALFGVVLGLWP